MNLEGIQLGGYRLLRLLGKGGMAEVWLAEQIALNRKVAVKVILEAPEETDIKQQVARFSREAQTLALLDHLNILPIIDYGSALGYLYLVTPYVPGGSLLEQLRRNWVSSARALDMVDSILAGLGYAHQKGIIHRDLKPGNILLRDGGHAIIADFGVAKIENDNLSLTQQGVVLGSPEYMAPEQFLGYAYYSSDLYSLSVMLYQMFSGRVPYKGTSATEIGMRHLNEMIPLPDPNIPEPIAKILHKALQKKPENRFDTADSMRTALSDARELLSPQQLQSKPPHHQIEERVSAFPTKIIQSKLTLNMPPVPPVINEPGQLPQNNSSVQAPAPVSSKPFKPLDIPLSQQSPLNFGSNSSDSSKSHENPPIMGKSGPIMPMPGKDRFEVLPKAKSNKPKTIKAKLVVPELPDETSSDSLPVINSKKAKDRPRQRLPLKLILGLVGLLVISVLVGVGSVLFANSALPGIVQPVSVSPATSVLANSLTAGPATTASTNGVTVTNNSAGINSTAIRNSPAPIVPIATSSSPSVPATSNLNPTTPVAGSSNPPPSTVVTITSTPPATISPALKATVTVTTSQPLASLQVSLLAANGTAARGNATLTDKGDGTFSIVVNMIGLGQGEHPSHIHQGTCQAEGPIKFELNSLTAGPDGTASATTVIKSDLVTLRSGNFYVDVANVSGDIFYVASCGTIKL
jgi:serine/threonine protein kinase